MQNSKKSKVLIVVLLILYYLSFGSVIDTGVPEPRIYNDLEMIRH